MVSPNYSEAPLPDVYERSAHKAQRVLNFLFGLNIVDVENVPLEGAAILAFSHRTNADPVVLGAATPRAVYGYAKKQIKKFPPAARYLRRRGAIYINRDKIGPQAIRAGLEVVQAKHLFAIATEGTRNKGPNIGPTKNGAGYFALKAEAQGIKCPIVPVALTTEHLYTNRHRPINVVYGEPIRVDPAHLLETPERQLIAELNEQTHDGLQSVFTHGLELQAAWEAGKAIKIDHP